MPRSTPTRADYLRHVLVAAEVLPARDEGLARLESWVATTVLASVEHPEHRRLLQAYATWRVLRRARRRAEHNSNGRTPTSYPRTQLLVAARFLGWLDQRGVTLAQCSQGDVDNWLTAGPAGYPVRDFLGWAAEHHHCPSMVVPTIGRTTGTATDPDERWALVARLLHDDTLDLTDRVAGSLLLLRPATVPDHPDDDRPSTQTRRRRLPALRNARHHRPGAPGRPAHRTHRQSPQPPRSGLFLTSLATRGLTAGFPTTTVTDLASLGTGLPPGEHGLTGYTSWVEEVDETVAWLNWTPVSGRQDLRDRLVPEQVQHRPTVFERAELDGVAVTVAAPARFEGSGLTRAVLRGGSYRGSVTPGDTVALAAAGSSLSTRSLVYCYSPDLDYTGHLRGTVSDAWLSQLRLVDNFAEELAARLPRGTALHVTADHGMVDVPEEARVDFATCPVLQAGVRALAGEPRARYVHCLPGASNDVLAAWQAELGDRMWVGRGADAMAAGLLGPHVTEVARSRVGDIVAVATSEVTVIDSTAEPLFSRLLGHHGALTDDELLVPLLST